MRFSRGFTLIELIVTLTIVGILAGFALPAMTTFIKNQRVSSQVNEFIADFGFARSEAVKRGGNVYMCAASAGSCSSSSNWATGWMVYADRSNPPNTTFEPATDDLLRQHDALSGQGIAFVDTGGGTVSAFAFDSRGAIGISPRFALCDDRGISFGRNIMFNTTGQTRVIKHQPPSQVVVCS
jgi:type IV fimbrial biogenesis protein FimT